MDKTVYIVISNLNNHKQIHRKREVARNTTPFVSVHLREHIREDVRNREDEHCAGHSNASWQKHLLRCDDIANQHSCYEYNSQTHLKKTNTFPFHFSLPLLI